MPERRTRLEKAAYFDKNVIVSMVREVLDDPGGKTFVILIYYDTEFSTYAQNEFGKNDQIRLANFLKNTNAKFMLIIKNTDFIYNLYNVKGLYIKSFDKKYLVSIKNRNDKNVEHLIITNYEI